MRTRTLYVVCFVIGLIAFSQPIKAQTTAFTYQGSLNNDGTAANGNFDFEFALFDAITGGTQVGSTVALTNVAVANGAFSVTLDFGNQFRGAVRFLEIRVKPTGGGSFIALSPRQNVASAPYSIKSLSSDSATIATSAINATNATNALQLGGLTADQYVLTGDARLSDARVPLPFSSNYIQNGVDRQTSNFNISGTGESAVFNARVQYNLDGNRVLSTVGVNLFVGVGAGQSNTVGYSNSFVGRNAGLANTTGQGNSFFGQEAGFSNLSGVRNSFFGYKSGFDNTTGENNAFFGYQVGSANTTGVENAFFGFYAGSGNTEGFSNAFFGTRAGAVNTTGNGNTIVGVDAQLGAGTLTNASALGNKAYVAQSNSLVLGSINGVNLATADTKVGIGTTAPATRLNVVGSTLFSNSSSASTLRGLVNLISTSGNANFYMQGQSGSGGINFGVSGSSPNASLFIAQYDGTTYLDRLKITPSGTVQIFELGSAGATALCRNASSEIATCSSSLRYKTNIGRFADGMAFLNRLRPISFDWKDGGMKDVGFGAEDIAKIDPRFVTYNDKGEVEGVKYDRLTTVLVNAVREQQTQIGSLERRLSEQNEVIERQNEAMVQQGEALKAQQNEIDVLKKFVCSQDPSAAFCTSPK